MKQAKFKETEIPYGDLEKIGISKMDILNWNREDIEALSSGKRTNLLQIRGTDSTGEKFEFKAKVSLSRKEDGSVGVLIHPVRNQIHNDIDLKPKEIEKLRNGDLITKSINGEKYLVQLDPEINEILKTQVKDIRLPSHIKDVELSSKQKEQLKKGQPISILSKGEKINIRINLNNTKGLEFSSLDFAQKQKIAYDRHNPQVIGTIHTDKNKEEFVNYHKKPKLEL